MQSTQDEIAERIGWPRRSIADWLKGIGGNPEIGEFANTDESDETESPLRLTAEELANARRPASIASGRTVAK